LIDAPVSFRNRRRAPPVAKETARASRRRRADRAAARSRALPARRSRRPVTQFGSPPRAVSGAPTAPRRPVRDAATRTASSKADARSARMDSAAVDASRTRHARSPSARSYKPPRR